MSEQYRPKLHISPSKGWLNDPNGLVFFKGQYHAFYQLEPNTKYAAGDKWWGHCVSDDLASWKHLDIALSPDDVGSMWSGSAVWDKDNVSGLFDGVKDGGMVLFYTAAARWQQQCVAYSADGLTFEKYDSGKPVLPVERDPLHLYDFRDPKVFWSDEFGKWIMIVAGGPVRFYSSDNLLDWEFETILDHVHTECPDIHPLTTSDGTTKWILNGCGVWYMIGELLKVNGKITFVPDNGSRIAWNAGGDIYATQSFGSMPDGRVVAIGWMTDVNYAGHRELLDTTDAFCHALTLPYELKLEKKSDGKLFVAQYPIKELELLRSGKIDKAEGLYEADITLNIAGATKAGMLINLSEDGSELIRAEYDVATKRFTLNRGLSGITPHGRFFEPRSAVVEPKDGKLNIQLFVDTASIELFVNGEVFTLLVFPTKQGTLKLYGDAKTEKMDIYKLNQAI